MSRVIHGDNYFCSSGPPPAYEDRPNMEKPETVDFERWFDRAIVDFKKPVGK